MFYRENDLLKESRNSETKLFSCNPIVPENRFDFIDAIKCCVDSDILDSLSFSNCENEQGLDYEVKIELNGENITPAIVEIVKYGNPSKIVSLDEAMKCAPWDIYPSYNSYDFIYT